MLQELGHGARRHGRRPRGAALEAGMRALGPAPGRGVRGEAPSGRQVGDVFAEFAASEALPLVDMLSCQGIERAKWIAHR